MRFPGDRRTSFSLIGFHLIGFALLATLSSEAARIKDIATLQGVRGNQLTGYGLVVGLAGTGDDRVPLTADSLKHALKALGIDQRDGEVSTKNVAAVLVTAELPPFAKTGSTLTVNVSSIGTAISLDGGVLMATALRGPDGMIYAMAQGRVLTTNRAGKYRATTLQTIRLLGSFHRQVTAEVPDGAKVEREIDYNWNSLGKLRYQLSHPDFTTATRMAVLINSELSGKYASAIDGGTVEVIPPYNYEVNPVQLVARIEGLEIETDSRAKVVVNPRTGTVILGHKVRILPVAIAHSNLNIEVLKPKPPIDPAEDPDGAIAGESEKEPQHVMTLDGSASIGDLVSGLNAMGASADDLISVLKSLRESGALVAELEIK